MTKLAVVSGSRLGPYQVTSPLGAGGMGEVYRARDLRLGRDVAIKILPAHRSADPERLRRFEQEARAAAALSHSNVLSLHDVGSENGVPYAVFEMLEGQTLGQRLETGPLPVRKAVDYAVQVCRGLAAAHARGVVHRDLKPDNVFLTADGQVKILDFGLAKLTGGAERVPSGGVDSPTPTEPGLFMGTAGYISRAGSWPSGRCPLRHLLGGSNPLRDARRPSALRRRDAGGHAGGDPHPGSAGDHRGLGAGPAGARPSRSSVPGEERGRALPVGTGPRLRPGGRFRPAVASRRRLRPHGPGCVPAALLAIATVALVVRTRRESLTGIGT